MRWRAGGKFVAASLLAGVMVASVAIPASAETETGTLGVCSSPLVGWTTANGSGTLKVKAPAAANYYNYGYYAGYRVRSRTIGLEGAWAAYASIDLLTSVTYAHCDPNPL